MTDATEVPVAGLLLAAGRGERFGVGTKQLAELDGSPLVLHVLAAARAAGLSPLCVVVGHDAEAVRAVLPDDVVVAVVEQGRPQSASLRAGLAALAGVGVDAAAVLLADEPGIDPSVIASVVEAWRTADGPVVRACYRDRPGHPLVADRSAWEAIAAVEGDRGARGATDVAPVLVPVDADAPIDVDGRTDLERLRARLRAADDEA